jgi:hypothetical protein
MAAHNQLEETWGAAASHAEHHIGDYIRYSIEGQARWGTIIWICAPVEQADQPRSVRYVVQPEENAPVPDLIWPGNILIGNGQPAAERDGATNVAELEQALTEMFATLSIPIIMRMEIDDSGQPFYVWHIGESTPQQPFGLYVGMERHLLGAMKLALEKLITHLGPSQASPEA